LLAKEIIRAEETSGSAFQSKACHEIAPESRRGGRFAKAAWSRRDHVATYPPQSP